MLPNPSFEAESVRHVPDYYFGDGMTVAPDVRGKFGRKCVRLTNDRPAGYVQMYWQCAPQHEAPAEYVWSVWLRGAKGGEKVQLRGPTENLTVALTGDWTRHSVPVIV